MPEWVKELLPFASPVIVAFIAVYGVLRDKGTRSTIETLNATVSHLTMLLNNATNAEAKARAAQEKAENETQSALSRLDELALELSNEHSRLLKLGEVRSFRHWLYLPSDAPPRTMICHNCHGDGPPRRMKPNYTHYYKSVHKDVDTSPTLAFICDHCRSKFEAGVDQEELEKIMAANFD